MIQDKVAKRAIKALIIMTTDDNGKLIPAENSVRYHYYLSGPPYWGKDYNAVYIENKISLRYDAYEPEKRIDIDSKKDGHLAEYRRNITEVNLFGKDAGKSRTINKNDLILYNCTIPKGAVYTEVESGEIIASRYILGEKYVFPKRFMHLEVNDEVWCGIYSDYNRKNRHFEFLGKTTISEIVWHKKGDCYDSSIAVKLNGISRTFYLNPYNTVDLKDSIHVGGAIVVSLTKEGLVKAFTDKFGKWIKTKLEEIEMIRNDIKEVDDFINAVNNCN